MLDSKGWLHRHSQTQWLRHLINFHGVLNGLNYFIMQVRTEEELVEAIATATEAQKNSLCFIEVLVHKDDTSKELLEWGSRVSAANCRPPNPQ